jgi:hypothetical protein
MARRPLTEAEKERNRTNLAKAREARTRKNAAPEPAAGPDGQNLALPAATKEPREAAVERRRRLIGDLDLETQALFSDAELAEIEATERKKAIEERKARALKDARGLARQYARIENDLIPADVLRDDAERQRLNEPVTFRVSVPMEGNGGTPGLKVNGFIYRHGSVHTRPRHVFESLRRTFYLAHLNEVMFSALNQDKPGNSAREVTARTIPQFEVMNAA